MGWSAIIGCLSTMSGCGAYSGGTNRPPFNGFAGCLMPDFNLKLHE